MTQGHGERIGSIGRELDLEQQQRAYHLRDLRLGRRAIAGHGELDRPWGVFMHTRAKRGRGAQGHAAGLAKFQGTVGIAVYEHALDGDSVGPVFKHQCSHGGIDAL